MDPIDIALLAARKRQSPRTGFVHLCYQDSAASDTIPFYENGCFVFALLAQKKTETVLEARQLISKLLAFQAVDGNFPVYLHEYPRCYDPHLGLRIAPLVLRMLNECSAILGEECKERLEHSLCAILAGAERMHAERPFSALWAFRFRVCKAVWEGHSVELPDLSFDTFSPSDWWEYWVTLQLIQPPTCDFYHQGLQMPIGSFTNQLSQDRFEPMPGLVDWMCAREREGRLQADHPLQIRLSALQSLQLLPLKQHIPDWIAEVSDSHVLLASKSTPRPVLLFWKDGSHLHSACLEASHALARGVTYQNGSLWIQLDLPPLSEPPREALFEVALYVDASADIQLLIEGLKATSFALQDKVTFASPTLQGCISFELVDGDGDFCGHLFRANRSTQKAATGALQYEAFDWKIALRTLRRSAQCSLAIRLDVQRLS